MSDLVNDALAVLAELCRPGCARILLAATAIALGLLALVAGQDVEPAAGFEGTDGRWGIARRMAPERVISTVDTEARHTGKSKSDASRRIPRAHRRPSRETGLITEAELTRASGDQGRDAVVGVAMIAGDRCRRRRS